MRKIAMAEQHATEECALKSGAPLNEEVQEDQVCARCNDLGSDLILANDDSRNKDALPNSQFNHKEFVIRTKVSGNSHIDNGEGPNRIGKMENEYQFRARRWTDVELRSYLEYHYLRLRDDPKKAKVWQPKVLSGSNPV
jgi:hypothetical protein